jgi:hypothetical protein
VSGTHVPWFDDRTYFSPERQACGAIVAQSYAPALDLVAERIARAAGLAVSVEDGVEAGTTTSASGRVSDMDGVLQIEMCRYGAAKWCGISRGTVTEASSRLRSFRRCRRQDGRQSKRTSQGSLRRIAGAACG